MAPKTEERKESLGYYLGLRGNEEKGREIVWPPFWVSLYLGGPRVLEKEGKVVFLWFVSYFAREAGHFFLLKGRVERKEKKVEER